MTVALALVAAASCRETAPPLTNVAPTKEAAAQAVVDALAARDRARLEALAISETEFKSYIWPKLPASDPKVGMPVDYLWADTSSKSRGYLAQTLAAHGGEQWTIADVAFEAAPTDYGSFRIHPGTRLSLRGPSGQHTERRLFGSMAETEAGWKVYSYIVD
jgi:hypothetical protein